MRRFTYTLFILFLFVQNTLQCGSSYTQESSSGYCSSCSDCQDRECGDDGYCCGIPNIAENNDECLKNSYYYLEPYDGSCTDHCGCDGFRICYQGYCAGTSYLYNTDYCYDSNYTDTGSSTGKFLLIFFGVFFGLCFLMCGLYICIFKKIYNNYKKKKQQKQMLQQEQAEQFNKLQQQNIQMQQQQQQQQMMGFAHNQYGFQNGAQFGVQNGVQFGPQNQNQQQQMYNQQFYPQMAPGFQPQNNNFQDQNGQFYQQQPYYQQQNGYGDSECFGYRKCSQNNCCGYPDYGGLYEECNFNGYKINEKNNNTCKDDCDCEGQRDSKKLKNVIIIVIIVFVTFIGTTFIVALCGFAKRKMQKYKIDDIQNVNQSQKDSSTVQSDKMNSKSQKSIQKLDYHEKQSEYSNQIKIQKTTQDNQKESNVKYEQQLQKSGKLNNEFKKFQISDQNLDNTNKFKDFDDEIIQIKKQQSDQLQRKVFKTDCNENQQQQNGTHYQGKQKQPNYYFKDIFYSKNNVEKIEINNDQNKKIDGKKKFDLTIQ